MPEGPNWHDVKAELERFRKLFEFVQSVLPKEMGEAMAFFSKAADERREAGEDPNAALRAFGPGAEMERHRAILEEEVRSQCKDLRHEFGNLTRAIGGLQKELDQTSAKTGDLAGQIARVEAQMANRPTGTADTTDGGKSPGAAAPAAAAASTADAPVDNSPARGDLSHLLMQSDGMASESLPFVSKKSLQSALDSLKDDIRNWLDMLHASMLNALSHKADNEQLSQVAQKVAQAAGVAGDSVASFAKRALLGRCASCEAPIVADPSKVKLPIPVGGPPGMMPFTQSAGCRDNMRAPDDRSLAPPKSPTTKLPRIQHERDYRQFPKGKILKNSSTPELRAIKHDDNAS